MAPPSSDGTPAAAAPVTADHATDGTPAAASTVTSSATGPTGPAASTRAAADPAATDGTPASADPAASAAPTPATAERAEPDHDPWERLIPTALMGTARRPVPDLPGLPVPVPETDDAPTALLHRAALAAARRRAGYTPRRAEPVEPAPHEDGPELSAAATEHLDEILHRRSGLLPEWLDLMGRTGCRVPGRSLPALLGAGHGGLRPAIAAVAGPRGRWLARFEPEWNYVHFYEPRGTFDAELWANGTANERRSTLLALRRTDPAAARDLVAEAMASEGEARQRWEYLDVLENGLCTDDEEVLTAVLTGDRSSYVRGDARALLARLPDSAHAGRLRSYLREVLGIGSDGQVRLTVVEPGRTDLSRDLNLAKSDKSESPWHARTERLRALIIHAPLDVWEGVEDKDAVYEQLQDKTGLNLFGALAEAATVQGSAERARSLLNGLDLADLNNLYYRPGDRSLPLGAMLSLLPAEEGCAWAHSVLKQEKKKAPSSSIGMILESVPRPWSRELSELAARMLTDPLNPGDYPERSRHIALKISLDHTAGLPDSPPETLSDRNQTCYQNALDTIRFRSAVNQELSRNAQGAVS